ncbi:MAG: hypothetical protein ACJAWI_000068 [Marinomonas primoryensis]
MRQITPRASANLTYGVMFFLVFRGKDVCFGDGWYGLYWFAYVC